MPQVGWLTQSRSKVDWTDRDSVRQWEASRRKMTAEEKAAERTDPMTYTSMWRYSNPKEYDDLFDHQKGLCGVCSNPLDDGISRVVVDHDHDTGRVRGILHQKCNVAIGLLGDSPEMLQRAIDYLRKDTP